MADCIYDTCVVGAGLWGSAVAYHLSCNAGMKVCLIGPEEPTPQEFETRTIYGSYYDEARITRQNTLDPLDGEMAQRTYHGHQILQNMTGIQLFKERPSIYFGPVGSKYVTQSKKTSELLGLNHMLQTHNQIRQLYPYLNIGDKNACVIQQTQSGMVNPRKLVLAQKTAARLQGCHIVEQIVGEICETYLPGHGRTLRLYLEDGQILHTRRALLCTGVFTNFKHLLPMHHQLDIKYISSQTFRVEISDQDAHILRNMPNVSNLAPEPNTDQPGIYACAPVKYPDGKTYVKIGNGDVEYIETQQEVLDWYRSKGNPEMTQILMKEMKTLLPDISWLSTQIDTCVETDTRTGLPYIDMITPNIGVAIGGNGVGARLGYEIAKMAANMIRKGHWDHDLPPHRFKVCYKSHMSKL